MAKKYLIIIYNNVISVYCQTKETFRQVKSGEKFSVSKTDEFWSWWNNAIIEHSNERKVDLCVISDTEDLTLDLPFTPVESSLWCLDHLGEYVRTNLGCNLVLFPSSLYDQRKPNLYVNFPIVKSVNIQTDLTSVQIKENYKSELKKFFEERMTEYKK